MLTPQGDIITADITGGAALARRVAELERICTELLALPRAQWAALPEALRARIRAVRR